MTYGPVRMFEDVFCKIWHFLTLVSKRNSAEIRGFCMYDLFGKVTYGLTVIAQ